jgi:hypothetical protein
MPAAPAMKSTKLGELVYIEHYGLKAREELPALMKLPVDKQWIEIGRALSDVKGCINCHTIDANGKPRMPLDAFPKLAEIRKTPADGCLQAKPDPAKVPAYKLTAKESAAITAFLKTGLTGAGSPAPTHAARVALRQGERADDVARESGQVAPSLFGAAPTRDGSRHQKVLHVDDDRHRRVHSSEDLDTTDAVEEGALLAAVRSRHLDRHEPCTKELVHEAPRHCGSRVHRRDLWSHDGGRHSFDAIEERPRVLAATVDGGLCQGSGHARSPTPASSAA